MSGTLAADSITKSFGSRLVLDRVSLVVPPGARIGLVGPNGIGKSTLLRVLAGLEHPESGSVTRTPPGLSVGYLPQEAVEGADETVRDYLARRVGLAGVEHGMDELAARLGDEPSLATAYSEALHEFLHRGGGDFDARVRTTLADLGLHADLASRLATLSGGEAERAALASIMLSRFDVLLLDEPTTNLDFEGLAMLETFVAEVPAALVIVSHDRAFLERTVTRVLEFEAETGRPSEYAGGFVEYQAARALARRRHEEAFGRYVEERGRFTSLLGERRTQARAGGKQANRRGTHALSSKVRSAERRLERLEEVEKPWRPWELHLSLAPERRSGERVVRLSGAIAERGAFRLGPLDLEVAWRDRVAVVGPNGSGKTTLLGALLGTMPLAAGSRDLGPGVVLGELEQGRELFAGAEPMLERFRSETGLAAAEARTVLAKFNLGADVALRPGASLSPGERTRAAIATLMTRGVNCLVLDEPTNHLDLEAIDELEAALEGYEGTVIMVTHDRRLLERFRPTRTIELPS